MSSWWDRDRDSRDSRAYHNRDRFSDREWDQHYRPEGRRYSAGSWESSSRYRPDERNWNERDRGKQQQLEQRGSGGYDRPPPPPLLSPPSHRIGRPDDYIRDDSRRNSVAKSTTSAAAKDLPPPPPPSALTDSSRNSVSSVSTARPLDYTHSSPRERGMLDTVPGIAGQHRQSSHNSSSSLVWARGKEDQRDRGEIENNRRGSSDRATDRYGDSPSITESPLSYAPPLASPATSVSTGIPPNQPVDGRMPSTNSPADGKGHAFSR